MNTLQKARAQLMVQQPFFAMILVATPVIIDRNIPIAATDGRSIFVNPDACEALSVGVLKTILAHEVLHIALLHVPRMIRMQYERRRWNFATDYAINLTLTDCGFEPFEGWLHDTQYTGMAADPIYDLLAPPPPPPPGGGHGQPGGPPTSGQGTPRGGGSRSTTVPRGCGALGEDMREPVDGSDPSAVAQLEREIQQRVAQAVTTARMAGKLPGSLERLVSEVLEPSVPWPAVLRDYMTRISTDAESWSRRNRRITHVVLPSRYSERLGEIVIIGDSSGSMYEDVLKGIAEVRSIAEMLHPEHIRLVWADTRVAGEQVFEEDEDVHAIVQGGGGTDMRVPLEYVEQYDPQVCILITDGYTPWPTDEPPYPLIVLCTTEEACPIGQVIRI